MQQTHTHKAMTGRIEAKKLLSRRRQSNYTFTVISTNTQDRLMKCSHLSQNHNTFNEEAAYDV